MFSTIITNAINFYDLLVTSLVKAAHIKEIYP